MKFFENVVKDTEEREALLNELNYLFTQKENLQNKINNIQEMLIKFYPLEDQKSKTISRDNFKVTLKQNYSSSKFDDEAYIINSVPKEELGKYFNTTIKPKKKLPKELPDYIREIYEKHIKDGEPTSISVSVKRLEE